MRMTNTNEAGEGESDFLVLLKRRWFVTVSAQLKCVFQSTNRDVLLVSCTHRWPGCVGYNRFSGNLKKGPRHTHTIA